MLNVEDFKITLKAIELISKGADVTDKTLEYLKGYITTKGNYVTRLTPNVVDFRCVMDDKLKAFANMPFNKVYRTGNEYKLEYRDDVEYVPDIDISYDIFVETIRVLHKAGISKFEGVDEDILDPAIAERMQAIADSFDRKAIPDCKFVKEMTVDATRLWFNTATAVIYQDEQEVARKMAEAYNKQRTSFNLNGFNELPVVDNRLYIALSEADRYKINKAIKARDGRQQLPEDIKYIVISKNIYDYFFCSYGSAFQSCFSLNSDHKGCYGMLPLGIFDGHYMIYATKDEPQKTSIDGTGSKWKTPYMLWRCWGWTSDDDDLLVDKLYTADKDRIVSEEMVNFLQSLGAITDTGTYYIKDEEEYLEFFNKYGLGFYTDSIMIDDDSISFVRGDGDREFTTSNRGSFHSMKRALEKVTDVDDKFDIMKPFDVCQGILANFNTCPTTGLKVAGDDKYHKLSKLFTEPVSSIMVITYCDGFFKFDECSRPTKAGSIKYAPGAYSPEMSPEVLYLADYPSASYRNIKAFKENIKGLVNSSEYDVVVVRYIEGDKVTYVKYKKKGVR